MSVLGERWRKKGRARREGKGKRGEGEERGGEGCTFDLEVLCHKTCYVYAAVSRLQEERHCPTQPLLGNYHYIIMTSSHTSE